MTLSASFSYNYEQGNPSPALSHKDIMKIKVCEAIKWYVEKNAEVSLRKLIQGLAGMALSEILNSRCNRITEPFW